MNQMWRKEQFPNEFDISRVIALFKRGSITDRAEKYRPISILQGLYKLFTTFVDLRLRRGLLFRIHPSQFGFLKGHSVEDAVCALLRAVGCVSSLRDLPLYILLLDWSKAFDTIDINRMIISPRRF